MGKGSRPRPTDRDKYGEGYDRIFGKKKFNIHSSGKKEHIGPAIKSKRLFDLEPKSYGARPRDEAAIARQEEVWRQKGEMNGSNKGNKRPKNKAG